MSIDLNNKASVRRAVKRMMARREIKQAYALAAKYAQHTGRLAFRDIHPGYADLCAKVVVTHDDFAHTTPFGEGWNQLPNWWEFKKEVGLDA